LVRQPPSGSVDYSTSRHTAGGATFAQQSAGKVDLDKFPGDTLDCRPELTPTYRVNAETCEGVALHLYDFVLADRPIQPRTPSATVW
jgi:hypothetical protein